MAVLYVGGGVYFGGGSGNVILSSAGDRLLERERAERLLCRLAWFRDVLEAVRVVGSGGMRYVRK